MSYKEMARRLEELEARREQQEKAKHRAWLESLSDAELEALCKDSPPEVEAAVQAMSDEDLDRALDGRMSDAEYEQHLRRAHDRMTGAGL